MIALITPTGNREKQIQLCAKWMLSQVYDGEVLWVIVDDGEEQTTGFIRDLFVSKDNWRIHIERPVPYWKEGENTQSRNLLKAIEVIDKWGYKDNIVNIFIIEDDDYYAPYYLEFMNICLTYYSLVGMAHSVYYNIQLGRYAIMKNEKHGSLFETAFNIKHLPLFKKVVRINKKAIDFIFWGLVPNEKKKLYDLYYENRLTYGIKGMAGRNGIGLGHKKEWANKIMSKKPLEDFIGINAQLYKEN